MAANGGKNHLGIYISPKEISIAQVRVGKGGKAEPEHLIRLPTNFAIKEGMLRPLSLNHEFFSEKASWIAPFKQAVKSISWDTSSAVITLSPQFSILRYFVMAGVERRFWSKSIPLESKKFIPVSFEEVVFDYTAVPVDDGKKLGVLFGLTQRKSVEFISETLKASGLSLAAVEINSISMERLFAFADPQAHDSKGYVHFSGSGTHMLFSHNGFPVLYRETEADAGGTLSERKRLDVKGAVQFVDRYVGGKDYKTIMLSGDGAEAWQPSAEKEAAPIAVSVWDAAQASSLKNSDAASFFAVGAALRGKVASDLKLDISGISTAAALEKEVQAYVWNITFLLGGVLLLLALISQARLFMIGSRLSTLSSRVADVPELSGGDAETIRTKIDRLQADGKTLSNMLSQPDPLAPKLATVADQIPANLWLMEIQYTSPLGVGEGQAGVTELRLIGETFLKGEAKLRAVDGFTRAMKVTREFKVFSPPMGRVDSTTDSEGGGGRQVSVPGADPLAPKASGFSVMCVSKRS